MRTSHLTNKKMSPAVYELRRQVISLIYEANKIVKLPRINVRVADNDPQILGTARMGGLIIWITEDVVASRCLVFHEILHAVFAQPHVWGCPLMAPRINPKLDNDTCNRLFLKYATKIKQ